MTKHERRMAFGLVAVWAVLFLPNLRTSPNWYGDEGEWMEKCWTFIHGMPRVGPVTNDFIFPYPYPPLYMLINGTLLKVFGNDLGVSRTLGAVEGLAAAAILFWIGCRLRDKTFGFLCAAAFLVYSEAVVNFRWVRSHPLGGTLSLAAVGFLIRYVQEKRLRDILLAGGMCSLATATNYMTYPLVGAVGLTALVVNAAEWRKPRAWGHVVVAGVAAGAYAGLFVLWYVAAQPGGRTQLMAQVGRLTSVASNETRPTFGGEVARFCENVWTLGFKTPTRLDPQRGWTGRDWWLVIATAGFVFLPVTRGKWLRLWLPVWLLVLMYGVFKKLNNVPLFFYPATTFLPLMAVGFAGVTVWAGELAARVVKGARWLPAGFGLAAFGLTTLAGSLSHFDTKIDQWSQRSPTEAEAAMRYVNEHTTTNDFVIVPKQIYWLVKHARKSMLTFCPRYDGGVNDMPVPVLIPRELYWFDCRLPNAKYVVMASGVDAHGQPQGIDLVYGRGLRGVPETVATMLTENWPVVWRGGREAAWANVGPNQPWPVVVGGEYLVLANPRFVKP